MGHPVYFPDQNKLGTNVGFVGNMDHSPDTFRQSQSSSTFNGGQSRGNSNYRSGYKGKKV